VSDDTSLAGLVRQSLLCLHRDVPAIYRRLSQSLPCDVALTLGDESLLVRQTLRGITIVEGCYRAPVSIVTSRAAVLAVVDGKQDLLSAILSDQLIVRGRTNDLLELEVVFRAYLQGAVRSEAFTRLLAVFRGGAT
jgi:hypothetical protein